MAASVAAAIPKNNCKLIWALNTPGLSKGVALVDLGAFIKPTEPIKA